MCRWKSYLQAVSQLYWSDFSVKPDQWGAEGVLQRINDRTSYAQENYHLKERLQDFLDEYIDLGILLKKQLGLGQSEQIKSQNSYTFYDNELTIDYGEIFIIEQQFCLKLKDQPKPEPDSIEILLSINEGGPYFQAKSKLNKVINQSAVSSVQSLESFESSETNEVDYVFEDQQVGLAMQQVCDALTICRKRGIHIFVIKQ